MRRVAIIVVGALIALALVGWVVIGANAAMLGEMRGGAERAAALAEQLHRQPGVRAATASYDPLDGRGASVHVQVSMTPAASIADWARVTRLLRTRLTVGELARLRQLVHVHGATAGGGDLRFQDASDWPPDAVLQRWFVQWTRIEDASGVRIRIVHSPQSAGLAGYEVASADDSRRFMARIERVNPLLRATFVEGYGFTASGPAPAGAAAVYQSLLRDHDPAAPLATTLPSDPAGRVVWGAGSLIVALASPRTQAAPSSGDARVVRALQTRATRTLRRSASWTNGTTVATVELTRCASGKRVTTGPDREFAAALAAVGHPLRAPAGSGVCQG